VTRLTETFVRDSVRAHLAAQGWSRKPDVKELRQTGADIKVWHSRYERAFVVECKGHASARCKNPKASDEGNFIHILGQIVTRMHADGVRGYKYRYHYGIALPADLKGKLVRRLPWDVADKLNLRAFLVNAAGAVEEYDWKSLRKLQRKPAS
jgi:hypothetical protein